MNRIRNVAASQKEREFTEILFRISILDKLKGQTFQKTTSGESR